MNVIVTLYMCFFVGGVLGGVIGGLRSKTEANAAANAAAGAQTGSCGAGLGKIPNFNVDSICVQHKLTENRYYNYI